MDFFSASEPMRGYSRDTFPEFSVVVTGMVLTGCSMRLVLERKYAPGEVAFTKPCTYFQEEDGTEGYSVLLSTTDTAQLSGVYAMHFILTDSNGNEYRKLDGTLEVLDSPQEVT